MKKTFLLEGIDCPVCAGAVEEGVKKIEGVDYANVNFLTTKLVIEADEAKMEEVVKKAKKFIKKTEPDVKVKDI